MKVLVSELYYTEVEIPDDVDNILDYVADKYYFPDQAIEDVNDMCTPFYDGYKECPKWKTSDFKVEIL